MRRVALIVLALVALAPFGAGAEPVPLGCWDLTHAPGLYDWPGAAMVTCPAATAASDPGALPRPVSAAAPAAAPAAVPSDGPTISFSGQVYFGVGLRY